MEMQTPPPPPKNSQFPQQEAMNTFRQEIQKAGQMGIQPDTFVQLGEFAKKAISDRAIYPVFKKAVLQSKLANPEDIKEGIDMQMLATFVALGKVAQQMVGQ